MISAVRSAIAETILPLVKRPPALQHAALCHRKSEDGQEVLLVTSSNGRWILPKGWPIDGLSGGETALQEAWEEGGVKTGEVSKKPIGTFSGVKKFDDGRKIPCETSVYAIDVTKIANDYPEADSRERQWVSVDEAEKLVDDSALLEVIKSL